MTNREFYNAIAKNEALSEDIRKHATEAITALDKRNASRKDKPTKTQTENKSLMNTLVATLIENGKGMLASELATAMGLSTQKITGLCRNLAKENRVVGVPTKVKNKGTLIMWCIPSDETENTAEAEVED